MLFSLALILIVGLTLGGLLNKLNIPGLLGMIITGIVLGPYALNLISPQILNISTDLREIALIVILMRAGLALDIKDLKKVGRPAILLCFVPATLELLAILIFAPMLFGISHIEAAIMGTVVAAVSPAVTVPRMIKLMNEGYGTDKSIPQLIMAGASVDDIYVIILFTAFMGMYQGGSFDALTILKVPVSIFLGLALGILTGLLFIKVFKKIHVSDTIKVIMLLCISFLFISLESAVKHVVPISGLLAVMALGGTILKGYDVLAKRLLKKFTKIWIGAEVILFVLVGAAVNIYTLKNAGIAAVLLIIIGLVFRIGGVNLSLVKTPLNSREKIFSSVAYMPKATVQAAIGAVPLAMGVAAGDIILTVAVLAILITAPIGAIGVDVLYKKYLNQQHINKR